MKLLAVINKGSIRPDTSSTKDHLRGFAATVKRELLQSQANLKCTLGSSTSSFDQNEQLRLEELLQLADLQLLEEAFANHHLLEDEEDHEASGKHCCRKHPRRVQQPGNLTLPEFQKVLSELLGSDSWNNQMEVLFNKVDTSCDGFVDWSEFCTFMLLQYKEKDYVKTKKETFLVQQPIIRLCLPNKQEPTTRILAISSPPPVWFVTVSKGGVLTVWDSDLHIQKSFEIADDASNTQVGKRRFKSWTTDAVYMPNVHKIAVATTSRDIHFFDVSTMNIFEEFHLFALNNIPTTLYYWHNAKSPSRGSLMIWGDDHGGLHLLWLLHPHSGIFQKPFTEQPGPQNIFIQDLKDHSRLLSYEEIPDVHPEAITKVLYVPERDLLITSSSSATVSVAITDIHRKRKGYTWRINKGVRCFDYSSSLDLLVTGGVDHRVCLWNQYVTSRPIAVFQEHNTAILDVVIYEPLGQIFSYSKDSILKVWDIFSHTCLQTMALKFPCVQPGRMLEQGDFPFLLVREPLHVLLISYADYIGMLTLVHSASGEELPVTHDAPLCGALYNSLFHQVVTGAEDSTIIVWDIETGTKSLLLDNAHGNEEITCMAFDDSQRKLITGARNGTTKVWNIQNGHNLHRLETVEEAEITAIIPLRDSTVLTTGWSRKMLTYDISQTENLHIAADRSWKGGQLHTEDILTADYCSVLGLLATASFDGDIIVWKSETQRPHLYLRKGQPSRASSHHRATPRVLSRSRCESRYSKHSGSQPPVDKLLFLQHRSSHSAIKEGAILISAEAGTLCWWSVFTDPHKLVSFYAPQEADESIFGLSANSDNTVLVSGDTGGWIRIWDISGYGLQPTEQVSERPPPLLCTWRAHKSTLVSVQLLIFGSDSFILSGSSDRTAKMWTVDGKCVGTFGQEKSWNLRNPNTFLPHKDYCDVNTTSNKEETLKQWTLAEMERGVISEEEPTKYIKDIKAKVSKDQTNEESVQQAKEKMAAVQLQSDREPATRLGSSMDGGLGGNSIIYAPETTSAKSKQEDILGHHLEEDLAKRRLGRKERRGVFGDVKVEKICRFGKLCSPFQALATPCFITVWRFKYRLAKILYLDYQQPHHPKDMENVTLPQDLSICPWMLSRGMSCTTESDLQILRHTSIDMNLENQFDPKFEQNL
ncbi:cilia- and flagella-associated protein 337-like [Lissotriton helveticus]